MNAHTYSSRLERIRKKKLRDFSSITRLQDALGRACRSFRHARLAQVSRTSTRALRDVWTYIPAQIIDSAGTVHILRVGRD